MLYDNSIFVLMIKVQEITKSYGHLQVLKGANLEIKKGEIVSIAGASGAGKSTFLHIIGTLDKQDSGNVSINGINTATLKSNALSLFRNRHIGFVFQFHHLLPEFSALENVCMPAFIAGIKKNEAVHNANRLMEIMNLTERASHKPSELSGGEQQRVAVARSLINNPDVILADEPSGNLDSVNAKELHKLFFKLREELQQTFIIVTHNNELADMADRKLLMKDGVISEKI